MGQPSSKSTINSGGKGKELSVIEQKSAPPPTEETKERSLKACSFDGLVEAKQKELLPGTREWVFDAVREWLQQKGSRRLCWIAGQAGAGKSVVCAKLLATAGVREHVKAWHFCRSDHDAREILESWAAMLTTHLCPKFQVAEVSKALCVSSIQELFELLLVAPLQRLACDAPPSLCCVIVIDGLDELSPLCLEELALIIPLFDRLPSFVRFLVTSRGEAEISTLLEPCDPVALELDDLHRRSDLRTYLAHVARKHVNLNTFSVADLERQLLKQFPQLELQNDLHALGMLFLRCKDLHAAAISVVEANDEAYKAICEIPDIRPERLVQCSNDVEELCADAAEAHEQLRMLFANHLRVGENLAGEPALNVHVEARTEEPDEIIDPGLKSKDSVLRKLSVKQPSRLKDLVRFTAQFPTCSKMQHFLDKLRQQPAATIRALKNKYSSPSPLGHRELKLTLELRLSSGRSHLCELRLNLKIMLKAQAMAIAMCEQVKLPVIRAHPEALYVLSKTLRRSVREAAVRELEAKAEGRFLCANLLSLLMEAPNNNKLEFAALASLPAGFSGICQSVIAKTTSSPKDWAVCARLIALIIAAREPLPVVVAKKLVGTKEVESNAVVSTMFPVCEGRFQSHASLTQWLQEEGEAKRPYDINTEDLKTAHQTLGRYCLQSLSEDEFCTRHALYHLCMGELFPVAFYEVASDVKWLLARAQSSPRALVADLEHASSFPSPFQSTLKLMAQALSMDLDELYHDYWSVPTRLMVRLLGNNSKEVRELLANLRKWAGPPQGWWCPIQPTFLSANGPMPHVFFFSAPTRSVRWSPERGLVAVACRDVVFVIHATSGKCVQSLYGHTDVVNAVDWSSDGKLCSGSTDNTVRVWEAESGRCVQTLAGHLNAVDAVAWSKDGQICSGSSDETVRVWDVSTGACVKVLREHTARVTAVAWSSDGNRICSTSYDNTARVWVPTNNRKAAVVLRHGAVVTAAAWSCEGKLCCGCADGMAFLFDGTDIGEKAPKSEWSFRHASSVSAVAWNKDGTSFCTVSDATLRFWHAASGKCVQTLNGHADTVTSVSWSKDGRLCSGSFDNTVRIWRVPSVPSKEPGEADILCDIIDSVAWSNDGRLCSGSRNGTAQVWKVANGRCTQTSKQVVSDRIGAGSRPAKICTMSWCHDNRICFGADNCVIYIWSSYLDHLTGHSGAVQAVSWSNDGSKICGGDDNTLRVWQVSPREGLETNIHPGAATAVAWSKDDKRIATGSSDSQVRVWTASPLECIRILEGHSQLVDAVVWIGVNQVCSGSYDGTVRVWEVESGKCLHVLPYNPLFSSPELALRKFVLPVGLHALESRISLCPTNPDLAVAIEGHVIHCLQRIGGSS